MKAKIFFILMLMTLTACATTTNQTTNTTQAPDFSATTISGKTVSLEQYQGEPVILYFTASWCPICAKNWPSLNTVYHEYDSVNFLAISIDPTDTKEVLTKLAEEENLDYPMVPGNPDIMRKFNVKSQATTVGINSDGSISFIKEKQVISAEEYRTLIESLK